LAFALVASAAFGQDSKQVALDSISAESIHEDIRFLADDKFKGRYARSPEAIEAAKWIAGEFEKAGLTPVAGGDGFFHAIGDVELAPNVVGIRKGSGSRVILITAHYDHLKPLPSTEHPMSREGRTIFAGADDNASGVAGVLAVARAMQQAELRLDASVVFVAFSAEELALRGARFLAGKPPVALSSIDALFNMDMISRGEPDLIFIDGPTYAAELKSRLDAANKQLTHAIDADINHNCAGFDPITLNHFCLTNGSDDDVRRPHQSRKILCSTVRDRDRCVSIIGSTAAIARGHHHRDRLADDVATTDDDDVLAGGLQAIIG